MSPTQSRFVLLARELADKIETLINNPESNDYPPAMRDNFPYMLENLRNMIHCVENNTVSPRHKRYKILSRIIIDQWPLTSDLGREIIEIENLYVKL